MCVCVWVSTAGTFTDVQSGPNEQEGDWLEGEKKSFSSTKMKAGRSFKL